MSGALELNFHHLRYFWAVAKEGNLTRTAERLRIAQSALSAQIRQLEDELGEPLFSREARRLELTEAGKIAFTYAEEIFATASELLTTLQQGRSADQVVRLGAVPGLSRELVRAFVQPLLLRPDAQVRLETAPFEALLGQLESHALEVTLSNRQPPRSPERRFRTRRLARQPVSLVAAWKPRRFRFPRDLAGHALVLPSNESETRVEFDALCARHGVRSRIAAEVDDVASLAMMVRDGDALGLLPSSTAREEVEKKRLHELCVVPEVFETLYAVTVDRDYQHPLVRPLLARDEVRLEPAAAKKARAS